MILVCHRFRFIGAERPKRRMTIREGDGLGKARDRRRMRVFGYKTSDRLLVEMTASATLVEAPDLFLAMSIRDSQSVTIGKAS